MSSFLKKNKQSFSANKLSSQPKIALVHDDFIQAGGAESLFATIASIWPKAPIYTSLVNWGKLPNSIDAGRLKISWMQKIPFAVHFYKILLPIYPLAFESFNFDGFDIVLSSTTRFAKSIITKPKTIHICYINSTPRFLWDSDIKKEYLPKVLRIIFGPILLWLKRWDKISSFRVDYYIANSQNVKESIERRYGLKSLVIYPFADLNFFKPPKIHNWKLKSQNYFLMVSRLVKWKKVDLAIRACTLQNRNLIIVGDGPDKSRLMNLVSTKSRVEFLGHVSREKLRELYQNCQTLIVTQQEDFGIAAVETQACGRPVIAYQKGGQAEIINDGKTGILFDRQSAQSLEDAISAASEIKWSVSACRKNSLRFSQAAFVGQLKKQVQLYAGKP